MTSWLSDTSANKVVKTYVNGFMDCSGYFLNRVGNVMIGNTDYPGYNVNQRSLLVNGRTQMNGNLTINGNISVNSTNIALGFQAGNTNQGTSGVAVGYQSGFNQAGANNTFLGYQAGYDGGAARTGASNTYIGYGTNANASNYSNSTAIGTGAVITASNQIVLGTTTEQVVIKGNLYSKATATNQSIATFEGPGGAGSTVNVDLCSYLNSSRTPTNRITCIDDSAYSGHYVFYSKTPGADLNTLTERMRIASDGTVSIPNRIVVGSTSNNTVSNFNNEIRMVSSNGLYHRIFESASILYILNSGNSGVYLSDGGQSWAAYSDIRLKKNITDISSSLQSILNIKPVTYNFKTDEESYRLRIGFIAQNVQEYFPLVINETIDEKYERPILGIAYTELIPYMVKAIQEQQIMISNLEARLSALENK